MAGVVVLLATSGTATAAMVLTAAGATEGFALTSFADGFPNTGGVGPVGITFTSGGAVMVSSYAAGKNAVFPTDTDGQHYAGAAISTSSYSAPSGLTTAGGNIYQALQGVGSLIQVDNSGNLVQTIVSGMSAATGVVTNPANGHIFVSTPGFANIWDVDPVAMTKTLFKSVNFDGLTITSDGKILYGANVSNGNIEGYSTSTGAKVFSSGFIAGGIDGSALGTGVLAGKIYVNTNSGTLVEVDLTTLNQVVIATGGSRGDFVTVDPNGSLLLTQTDSVLRLTPPAGGGFGGAVPEPATITLAGFGICGLLGYHWRRHRNKGSRDLPQTRP
jgi:hypothetical protein